MKPFVFALFLFLIGCATEPEPLAYGKDQCHACKMTLMDRKFGAELVTKKGKVYKFDDINCLFNFYKGTDVSKEDYQHTLVIDFSQPEKLIDAQKAYFLKSSEVMSPMASGVAAFEFQNSELTTKWQATPLTWQELEKQLGE
jgi:copper chaperone NosL